MPVGPQQPNNPIPPASNVVQNVITNALYEMNVVAPGETPDPGEMAFALSKFNQLLDSWATQKVYIYALQLLGDPLVSGSNFILTPGLQPHTIGPTPAPNSTSPAPTFVVDGERPARLANVNIILNNVSPNVRFPLNKRDKDWWASNRVQSIQTTLPTDYYYREDWPNGSIFFWPVPNFAYGAEFEIETLLQGAAQLDTVFSFPVGYELAITLTLAELLCPSFEKPPNQILVGAAGKARQNIAGLNAQPPHINLDDFGGPSNRGNRRSNFNYRTGLTTP
jgi:hypothetical protein